MKFYDRLLFSCLLLGKQSKMGCFPFGTKQALRARAVIS